LTRVSTGTEGLDSLLGGGFPKGSIVLITGNPGTGKTIFSTQFLYKGAMVGRERGVYVSFAEAKDEFGQDAKSVGFDLDALSRKGLFKIVDCVSMTESGISEMLGDMVQSVADFKPQRLVIDPISAILQGLGRAETRSLLHNVFGKIIKRHQITTLLVGEIPYGDKHTGFGIEEFVVDGVITLGRSQDNFRTLGVRKMRGTRLSESNVFFTLNNGFQIIRPPAAPRPGKTESWKVIDDMKGRFSTGSHDLDALVDGGYPEGRYVLLETDANVPIYVVNLFVLPLAWNFLSQGRGVLFLPVLGADGEEIKKLLTEHVRSEVFVKQVRVFEQAKEGRDQTAPYLIVGGNPEDPLQHIEELLNKTSLKLRKDTGQPVLRIIGYPALESLYAGQIDLLFKEIGSEIAVNRSLGNLTLAVARPGLQITPRVLNIVDWHIRLIERNGCIFCHVVKPKPTPYAAVERAMSGGYQTLRLIPMV
jgi:KaiC/GvpD/RAD55 family RecA-like ATPase